MSIAERLFRIVFSLVGLSLFIPTFFIVFPLYFLVFNFWPKKKAPFVAHRITQFWGKLTQCAIGLRVSIKNKDYIDPQQAYIFVSNHRSQLDVVLAPNSCNNTFRFLAKAELTKVPVIGYVIKNLYIPVSRKSKEDRVRSMADMQRSLREGISIYLYPEGTRNKSEEPVLPFHDGAFRLAIESQFPIAVFTLLDSQRLLSPNRSFDLCPGTIHCIWDEPISTKGLTEADVPMLKEKVRNIMLKRLQNKSCF